MSPGKRQCHGSFPLLCSEGVRPEPLAITSVVQPIYTCWDNRCRGWTPQATVGAASCVLEAGYCLPDMLWPGNLDWNHSPTISFQCLQGVDPAKPPSVLPHAFRMRGTVEGSIAIRNLAEMLESDTELTRYTAAKVLASACKPGYYISESVLVERGDAGFRHRVHPLHRRQGARLSLCCCEITRPSLYSVRCEIGYLCQGGVVHLGCCRLLLPGVVIGERH